MISLSDYVKKNVSAFMDLAVEQGENVEFSKLTYWPR